MGKKIWLDPESGEVVKGGRRGKKYVAIDYVGKDWTFSAITKTYYCQHHNTYHAIVYRGRAKEYPNYYRYEEILGEAMGCPTATEITTIGYLIAKKYKYGAYHLLAELREKHPETYRRLIFRITYTYLERGYEAVDKLLGSIYKALHTTEKGGLRREVAERLGEALGDGETDPAPRDISPPEYYLEEM